jgi:hypothetical protein
MSPSPAIASFQVFILSPMRDCKSCSGKNQIEILLRLRKPLPGGGYVLMAMPLEKQEG